MPSQLEDFTKTGVLTRAYPLVGEYCPHNLQDGFLVEERIKIIVKTMARDLDTHHQEGHCISTFDHRNIRINAAGHAQIIGVTHTAKTKENIKKNYLDLHDVVFKTIFRNFSYQQQVPSEWRMLLLLMKRNCIGNEYLICNNVALMPLAIRMLFFYLCYEHVTFSMWKTKKQKQKRILQKLPYLKNWPDLLKGNYLLEESFEHKYHDITTPEGFFTFYRDTNKHRMDRCHLLELVGAYTAIFFEKNLLVRYPLYLFVLQEELHREKELEELEPHVLF
ncbi:uncharacterized protein LOC124689637 [Lolium rigidum]|uniref:uncharacterized protein LOC124689637 n=1 Tax=Lolium rigidum TaxID=89674 RepID=UPI001F5D0692|nr:uncharacterized protein LOC124689637 [Lolium rigidum]